MDPSVKKDQSLIWTTRPARLAANVSAPDTDPAAAEVFQEIQGAIVLQQVIPQLIGIESDNRVEDKDKMCNDKDELMPIFADLRQHNLSYMDNEEFLQRNCYGGGRKKRVDSDLDYDPEDAKKRKVKKKSRKDTRKRRKGKARSLQQIASVNARNAKRDKGKDRR